MKVRRNALHRVSEAMKGRMSLYGFRIDPDLRILYMPNREAFTFREGLESAEIKKILLGYMRTLEVSAKLTREIVHKKIEDDLNEPLSL